MTVLGFQYGAIGTDSPVAPQPGHSQSNDSELGPAGPAEPTGPSLWRATDLEPARQPEWLATKRIPKAAVSILVGDEGIGKSLMWVWAAAAITTGKPLHGFGIPVRDPQDVVLIITEDDWSFTVRPRLEVAGADLDRVIVFCEEADGSGSPRFPKDMHVIADAWHDGLRPALIVVDAWLDTVASTSSVRDPQQARNALHPWKEAATRMGTAVLLLAHTNRISTGNARDKYGATGALRQKARMTLYAQLDSESGELLIGPEKSNLVGPVPASRFRIEPVQHFAPSDEGDGTIPLLVHLGDDRRTARDIIAEQAEDSDGDGGGVEAFLEDLLNPDPQPANEVYKGGDAHGYSRDVLKRAKKRLGIRAVRGPGDRPQWLWQWPQT